MEWGPVEARGQHIMPRVSRETRPAMNIIFLYTPTSGPQAHPTPPPHTIPDVMCEPRYLGSVILPYVPTSLAYPHNYRMRLWLGWPMSWPIYASRQTSKRSCFRCRLYSFQVLTCTEMGPAQGGNSPTLLGPWNLQAQGSGGMAIAGGCNQPHCAPFPLCVLLLHSPYMTHPAS